MDRTAKSALGFFFVLLLMASLACGIGGVELPGGENGSAGAAATAEGAARMAATAVAQVTIPAGAMETAESAAGQAGGLAATAIALAGERGGDLVATLEASNFDIQVDVNVEPLRQKVANAQPDANGNVTITFTEQELNEAIAFRATGGTEQAFELRNPTLSFSEGNVILLAQINQPLEGELRATFLPTVQGNQLRFNLTAASIGGVSVPTAVLSLAEARLNTSMALITAALPSNYTLTDITAGNGALTISAQRSN